MKKSILTIVLLAFSLALVAQTKKVAVMETKNIEGVSAFQSNMVRGGMEVAVANAPGYEGYDRAAFDIIMKEQNFQRSGAVKDSDIRRLGEMAGVQYVLVTEASSDGNGFFILAKLLDVETGQYGNAVNTFCDASGQEIYKASNELGTRLFGRSANSNNSENNLPKSTAKTTYQTVSKNGVFSVGPSTKVNFSKGNLQYQASTGTWRFAEHQWDVIGGANSSISSNNVRWIDLFGWGTGNNPNNSSTIWNNYGSFSDWGNNKISNGDHKNWHTLTYDEWMYVFNKRNTSSGLRYAKAIVNGVNGVVLLPDNWDSSIFRLNGANKLSVSFNINNITQTEWCKILEANGAVFLPAAGCRNGTSISCVGSEGRYWSATYLGVGTAYNLKFNDSYLGYSGYDDKRSCGFSVRLVCLAVD